MTPPTYSRREVKQSLRRLLAMRERRDSKDIHVRVIDMERGLNWLSIYYPEEYEILVICGLFGTTFRDAETILFDDHATLHRQFNSGVAHITDHLNGDAIAL